MILFYSGDNTTGKQAFLPEQVLSKKKPAIMLSYWNLHFNYGQIYRWRRHIERRTRGVKK